MKILYCDTLFGAFQRYDNLDLCGRPFTDTFRNLANSHPIMDVFATKPIKADFFGLVSWNDKQHRDKFDFNEYDIIWLYLNSNPHIDPCWWEFPQKIRELAPDAIIVVTTDYEHLSMFSRRMRENWNHATIMHTITKYGQQFFSSQLSIPVFFGLPYWVPSPSNRFPDLLPYEQREGIVVLHHSISGNFHFTAETLALTELPITVLDSVHGTHESRRQRMLKLFNHFGVDVKYLFRIPWVKYIDIVNHSRVAFDYEYYGQSRFAYECALLKIPVVGSPNAENARILFPALNFSDPTVDNLAGTIQKVYSDREFYSLVTEQAYCQATEDYSLNACTIRLFKKMRELMNIYKGASV